MAKPPSIADILAGVDLGNVRRYEISHPSGFSIRADDADDHQRAMEALRQIGPLVPMGPAASAPLASVAASPPTSGISLAEASRKWQLALAGKNKLEKTRGAKRAAVDGFCAWKQSTQSPGCPPALLNTISRTDCSEWFIHLQQGQNRLNARTVENKFIYLAGFFDWAAAGGHYPKGDNPARGHAAVPKKIKRAMAKSNGWQAFTPEQLKAIFNPADYASMSGDAARWLPLMALYTGARSNELAHLELDDCYDMPDGTPVLSFNLRGEHKSLKTEASERITPVHPDLITLGLWERVKRHKAAGEVKLFPELNFNAQNGPANGPQRAFTRYLARLGIEARGGGRIGHHSFRDTVINQMKAAGVRREMREEYTGHELSDRQEHAHAYELDFTPRGLANLCHPAHHFDIEIIDLKFYKQI